MVAIVDYGVGNLFSLLSSLKHIGCGAVVTSDAARIRECDKIILPGVGAFEDAAKKLRSRGLDEVIIRQAREGKPLLGVCLGMQLLFEASLENGEHRGLGLIPGVVAPIRPIVPEHCKVPHIGWNRLIYPDTKKSELFKYVDDETYVYFVHSYHAQCAEEYVTAKAEYGAELTAAVSRGNVMGTQFHPEKSGGKGLCILRAFSEMN